jgi:formate-dependent nitrite reductase membrane component NrfD
LPSPKFFLAVWLKYFAAGCLGIGIALVLDYFGLLGVQKEGSSGELLAAAGFLVAGGLMLWWGTVLRRRT